MRLIDADKMLEYLKRLVAFSDSRDRIRLYNFVKEMPTIDAIEVVRCKDCKQYKHYSSVFGKAMMCHLLCTKTKDIDYCSYGERKEE